MSITTKEWKAVIKDASEFNSSWYGHQRHDGTLSL